MTSEPLQTTSLLPPPFAWIDIPGGEVRLEDRGGYLVQATTFTVAPFAIAQYPVTNAQFQVFVAAPDGYALETWWDYSDDARMWRLENLEPKPVQFGGLDAPRTHVTWYEAVAFCRWLSAKTGATIRLPAETEWQRAAQGDDGRLFPWGDEWDGTRCKTNVQQANIGPGSVMDYAGIGDSPFGVVDMVGNVWEWCLTKWSTGANTLDGDAVRVLRGGSWFDNVIRDFYVTARRSWNPDITSDLRGFRLVREV